MALTGGWLNQCTDGTCPGGIGTLYLANANEVSSVTTSATGEVTAITMTTSAAVFYEVEFRDDSGSFTSTVTVDPVTQAKSVEIIGTGIITCRSQNLRDFVEELALQACGLVAVWVESTGLYWIAGHVEVGNKKRPFRLTTAEGLTGTAFTDPNQETITLTCRTTEKERVLLDGAVVMAALI